MRKQPALLSPTRTTFVHALDAVWCFSTRAIDNIIVMNLAKLIRNSFTVFLLLSYPFNFWGPVSIASFYFWLMLNFSTFNFFQMNFLVCQILALFFASFFRSYLHTSKVTTNIRHAFGLTLGLYFGYFCFGQQAIHIVGLPAVCYIIIRTQNPQIVQR